ncbi:hypothetical protein HG530_005836 [Fusarium avenaceum]|nr:hypothetical protein HG530_005836 [Fusarium avenaceum]
MAEEEVKEHHVKLPSPLAASEYLPSCPYRFPFQLFLGRLKVKFVKTNLLGRINNIVIVTPVGVIIIELGHSHALPETQFLAMRLLVNQSVPAPLVLIVLASVFTQVLVGSTGVCLHLPDLLAQTGILVARIGELLAVRTVPGGYVADVFGLVLVELSKQVGHGVGVLGEELGVGIATELGLFEAFGEEGNMSIDILFLA